MIIVQDSKSKMKYYSIMLTSTLSSNNTDQYSRFSMAGYIFILLGLILGILSLSVSHRLFKFAEFIYGVIGLVLLCVGISGIWSSVRKYS